MALRIRRKSYDNINQQAVRLVSKLSGGYAQPVNYISGRLRVDNSIYDSATARRNKRRIERVIDTANRYADNIAKVNSRINEPYINSTQYGEVMNAKLTKYPMMTYANIIPNSMRSNITAGYTPRTSQNVTTKSKGNSNG